MESEITVSVVIPCLNEANSLAICIDKAQTAMKNAGIAGEVVVGDNGSTDGSIQIALDHGARVAHATQKGYGHALRAGIEAARGKFIIMGDADDSYDFIEVPRFVAKWQEGYDIVMGNRFRGEIKPGAMPWHHKYIGNPVLSGLVRLFFWTNIGDSHCGMRGFKKEVYKQMDLRTTGMEFASEFVIKAVKLRVPITEIPITLWPDKRGRPPHLRSFRDGWRHLRFMLLYAPNWLFLGPGLLLLALGLFLVFWLFPSSRTIGKIELDVHTMFFGMIFTLLGSQIIATGLFAKTFSYSARFAATEGIISVWLKRITFEHGLIVGGALALLGFVGDLRIFWQWASSGFGPLDQMRRIIFWSLWMFLGLQIIFSTFFLSMLGVARRTFIGDNELSEGVE
ncbi:MAG: glycosyltransferase family 2 protein [Pirellulaceae bacterium]|nr:glycosyltransferase family 2 protein [Pirellulaceae bacterium]